MAVKNEAGAGAWLRLPAVAGFTAAKAAQLLVTRPAALLGAADFVRLLPAALQKRRQIQGRRTAAPSEVERWFEPIRGAF
jgi:hypothetical protein